MSTRRRLLAPFLFAIALAIAIAGQYRDELFSSLAYDPFKVSRATQKRIDAIEAELESDEDLPRWAGCYYMGDGLGSNESLWVAPDSGFAYVLRGCVGIYDQNRGDVEVDGDLLILKPFASGELRSKGRIDAHLRVVDLGGRRYLIGSSQRIAFCDDVRAGREPRERVQGLYLAERTDLEMPAATLAADLPYCDPQLEAIGARIVDLKEPSRDATLADLEKWHLTLDRGRDAGLCRGMWLRVEDPEVPFFYARVDDVSADSAVAIAYHRIGNRRPELGWYLVRTHDR